MQATVRTVFPALTSGFEVNDGQADPAVKVLSRAPGSAFFLAGGEAVVTLSDQPTTLRIRPVGANPQAEAVGDAPLPGRIHDYHGGEPDRWRLDIALHQIVVYGDIYEGIDLVYRLAPGGLDYDFVLAPGADPERLRVEFPGADRVSIETDGTLVVAIGDHQVHQHRPHIYQETARGRASIPGGYVLIGRNQVGFEIGPYDPERPLVIDPVLTYSTFLGATGAECLAIATDQAGNIYVAGRTAGGTVPLANAFQPTPGGGSDVFVTKLDPTGTTLIYSTYLGGSGQDEGIGLAVDRAENAYVTGVTTSANFPVTTGAFQTALAGGSDAFVAKLDPRGGLVYSTYLGGAADDRALGIAVDTSGNAYVAGSTASRNFPVRAQRAWWWPWRRPLQRNHGGGVTDAFVTKLNAAGSALVYSTYLGGTGEDGATGIALCGDNWPHITGVTSSPNFPTTPNAYQSALAGAENAFFAKLNFAGSALVYSTYLGGSGSDTGMDIAVTGNATAYITGFTDSANFPATPGVVQTGLSGLQDAFAARFDRSGKLVYSTYLGGSGLDQGLGIAFDQAGNAFVTGVTTSPNFPQANAVQPGYGGGPFDAFVAELDPKGTTLVFSTFLGGSNDDRGTDVTVDQAGAAYVTGWTYSGNFPTVKPFQSVLGGSPDVFIAILS